ncbi:hypothetical protein IJI86_02300 [Candidatus Saccharibacteria bacterium]|nr:hypothetical protein [Candidatus Saccharibacteria bacterium]
MNSFYHSFSIGFNYWFILWPFQIILMVGFGFSNAKLNKKTNKIMRRDKEGKIANLFAILMSIILMIAVIMESTAGIIQMIDNHLGPNDDPMWSLVLFVFGMLAFAVLSYCIFFGAEVFGKQVKIAILRKWRRSRMR